MTGKLTTVTIHDRVCHVYRRQSSADGERQRPLPIFYWGVGEGGRDSVLAVVSHVEERLPDAAFIVAAHEAGSWNDDFSPWAAPAVFGEEDFGGRGDITLGWLADHFVPYVEDGLSGAVRFAAGYSLAGLFGLWAYCESGLFAGAVCCSGSLWYDGLPAYVVSRASAHREGAQYLYLSLGDREEKTKNRRMAAVGENTRAAYALLCESQENVKGIFEWNPGGHFSEPDLRISKGIYWILQHFDV